MVTLFGILQLLPGIVGSGEPRKGVVSFWKHVNTGDIQCSEVSKRKNTNTHTHAHSLRLEVLSQVTPNLPRSGEVERSGYLLWRGSLCLWSKHTIQRETEYVPFHLIYHSTYWTRTPMHYVVCDYKVL